MTLFFWIGAHLDSGGGSYMEKWSGRWLLVTRVCNLQSAMIQVEYLPLIGTYSIILYFYVLELGHCFKNRNNELCPAIHTSGVFFLKEKTSELVDLTMLLLINEYKLSIKRLKFATSGKLVPQSFKKER